MRPPKRGFELQRPLLSPADLRMKGLVVRDADKAAVRIIALADSYRTGNGHLVDGMGLISNLL